MISGWHYRIVSTGGAIAATMVALLIANHPITQALVTEYPPLARRLDPIVLSGTELLLALALSAAVVFVCLIPLYKPRPRRALDTIFLAQKRVITALFALATIGYFNWSHRLPRATLFIAGMILIVIIPAWFLVIRNRPSTKAGRVLIVGNDLDQIRQVMTAVDMPVVGYLAPPITLESKANKPIADGGFLQTRIGNIECLGGISRLEQVLIQYNIDTVVLAFEKTDRGEFFGVLEVCHSHGVQAKVLREHANSVLLSKESANDLITIDLEPWDWQDRLFKRWFDIIFSSIGLLIFGPLLGLIALAIKLDSPGPIFYTQSRTAGLGSTFKIRKFRTMVPDSEMANPVDDEENDQITRVGRLLRKSHFDELPQLLSILIGDMSVVGPRAVWIDEEELLERQAVQWRKRWFVKPGLTGLAQINEVSSTNPEKKLQYDLEYIRRQSFWFDLKIVIRQVWLAVTDVYALARKRDLNTGDPTK